MSQACLICDEHVPTGNAYVVLRGAVDGSGAFKTQELAGLIHGACLDEQDRQRTIPLDDIGTLVIQTR